MHCPGLTQRAVASGYVMYLLLEFCGVWMGRPVEAFQVGLSGPPRNAHQIQIEFFDYRSGAQLKHNKAMFWTADDSTDVSIAREDYRKLKQAEL